MKILKKFPIVLAALLLVYGIYFSFKINHQKTSSNLVSSPIPTEAQISDSDSIIPTISQTPLITVIAEKLDTPWAIGFLPSGDMLVTERKGTVRLVKDGVLQEMPVAVINSKELAEGGLMGIALHPNFNSNHFVYVYYTYAADGAKNLNRVSRYVFDGSSFSDERIILDGIAASSRHDGGRLKFGPDKMLYLTVGDAEEPSRAQDTNSLSGKILRITDEGNPAPGNPFDNFVYTYGHRNPQGLAWDKNGQLWATEHGPSGAQTGNDEFNKIDVGGNYGWPEIKGKQTKDGMIAPIIESGFLNAWAPAGLAYLDGKFYFAGLRGSALYEVDEGTTNLITYLKNEFGRLREVVVGPDNMLYVTTSNLDGRGTPKTGDDKILRINPERL